MKENTLADQDMNSSLPEGATRDFLLEEQQQRRRDLDRLISQMESDQRNGILFTGVIWGWLITNGDTITGRVNLIAVILPTLLIAFLYHRYRGLSESIRLIANYTRLLEQEFRVPKGLGWESHVFGLRQSGKWPASLGRRAHLLWRSLILLNVLIGAVYYFR
jgi:hypothetical protein